MDLAGLSSALLPTLLIAASALAAVAGLQGADRRRPAARPIGQPSDPVTPRPDEGDPGPAPVTHADAIGAAGSNLLDIVDDLANLSRIETGRLTIHEQPFSVQDCVDGVTQMLALSAYHKGLDFIRAVDADVPALVQGDPLRLRQILVNLVTNAVKFTRNGAVRIDVHLIAAGDGQTELEFAVTDTGIGISEQDQGELFRPFARARHAIGTQGTGLGLVITRRLCEAMGGTIGVSSKPEEGSRFAVRVPFRTATGTPPVLPLPPDLSGRRILVSCADDRLAHWLNDFLSRHGAHYDWVDGEAQLVAADLEGYDLALIHVGQKLLTSPDRLASFGALVHERVNVLCLVGTGSGYSLQRVERLFGGEALPAHAPAASICARIVELANDTAPPPAAAAGNETAQGALQGVRLLVAEDDTSSRDYLRIMLSGHGADVEVCKDGNEAVELVQRRKYDLVLMDARMPGCDGPTAVRRLRADGFSVPVIGLTAAAAECQDATEAGMTECLVKPLRAEDLLQAIAAVCSTGGGISQRDFLDEEMLSSLNSELPRHAMRLRTALAQGNRAALFEEAHKLNGIASLCGFGQLRRLAGQLEACLRADQPGDIDVLANDVLVEVDAVCEQISVSLSEGRG